MPDDALNGLYGERPGLHDLIDCLTSITACQPCAHKWLINTDDFGSLSVLMPCKPLMLYALHVFHLRADDEAPRTQTLDSVRACPG